MLSFFTPVLKIQKNRQVLRETDERMAKYSRRGLISNFVIFLLCMAVGSFSSKQPFMAITLTIGLLITTLLRGYLLVRFESLYPRAPALWRTRYFYATLLGAAWWGLIVAIETIVVGIESEGPLLWLYTIVFFSMTANVFAPYKQFLALYQSLGLIPGAFCLLFTGETTGIIYGAVVFFFIWLLHHQSEQTADNYWERLESNDALARKTESLEEEKRDTRATAQLHREYMLLLKQELQIQLNTKRGSRDGDYSAGDSAATSSKDTQIEKGKKIAYPTPHTTEARRPRLQQLYSNVGDFYQILSKEINFQERIFNPRALLQYLISVSASEAAEKGIDVELSLSPNLPHLIFGDTERLSQIADAMLVNMIEQLDEGTLFIDIEYLQERGKAGQLHILAAHQPHTTKSLFAHANASEDIQLSLDLALAIGLAEAQGGDLSISSTNQGTQLRYRAKYANRITAEPERKASKVLQGKRVMVVHENPRVLDAKRQDLSILGCEVSTETKFKRVMPALKSAISKQSPFAAVLFHTHLSPKSTVEFSQTLLSESDCKLTHQIIMGSSKVKRDPDLKALLEQNYIHWLDKPAIAGDFYTCLWDIFHDKELDETKNEHVAIVSPGKTEDLVAHLTASHLNCHEFDSVKLLLQATEKKAFTQFIFAYADDSLTACYQQIHTRFPLATIIAYDYASEALRHLQAGTDRFIAVGTPLEQLTAKTYIQL